MQSFGTVAAPSLWFWFVLLFCWFFCRKRNSTQWQTTCTIITPWWYYCRTTMVSKTCHPLPWKLSRIKKHEQRQHVGTGAAPLDCIIFLAHIIIMKLKLKMWNLNSKFAGFIFFGKHQCKTLKILYAKNNGVPRCLLGFWKGREPQNFVKQAPPNTPQHKAYCVGVFSEGFFLCLKPLEETPTEPHNAKL